MAFECCCLRARRLAEFRPLSAQSRQLRVDLVHLGIEALFFGFKDSVVDSLDQAAKFQQTFSNRALAMLQGVQQWLASQEQNRPLKSNARTKRVHVGIGVYLMQRSGEIDSSRPKKMPSQSARVARVKSHRPP